MELKIRDSLRLPLTITGKIDVVVDTVDPNRDSPATIHELSKRVLQSSTNTPLNKSAQLPDSSER